MSNHTPAAQHGRGLPRRIRKSFDTKSEAQRYERWIIATQNNKGWVEKPSDRRPLTELIELWWVHHGRTLKDGEAIKKNFSTYLIAWITHGATKSRARAWLNIGLIAWLRV